MTDNSRMRTARFRVSEMDEVTAQAGQLKLTTYYDTGDTPQNSKVLRLTIGGKLLDCFDKAEAKWGTLALARNGDVYEGPIAERLDRFKLADITGGTSEAISQEDDLEIAMYLTASVHQDCTLLSGTAVAGSTRRIAQLWHGQSLGDCVRTLGPDGTMLARKTTLMFSKPPSVEWDRVNAHFPVCFSPLPWGSRPAETAEPAKQSNRKTLKTLFKGLSSRRSGSSELSQAGSQPQHAEASTRSSDGASCSAPTATPRLLVPAPEQATHLEAPAWYEHKVNGETEEIHSVSTAMRTDPLPPGDSQIWLDVYVRLSRNNETEGSGA